MPSMLATKLSWGLVTLLMITNGVDGSSGQVGRTGLGGHSSRPGSRQHSSPFSKSAATRSHQHTQQQQQTQQQTQQQQTQQRRRPSRKSRPDQPETDPEKKLGFGGLTINEMAKLVPDTEEQRPSSESYLNIIALHATAGKEFWSHMIKVLCTLNKFMRCPAVPGGATEEEWKTIDIDMWFRTSRHMMEKLHASGRKYRIIHVVRDPFDSIIAAYQYNEITREVKALNETIAEQHINVTSLEDLAIRGLHYPNTKDVTLKDEAVMTREIHVNLFIWADKSYHDILAQERQYIGLKSDKNVMTLDFIDVWHQQQEAIKTAFSFLKLPFRTFGRDVLFTAQVARYCPGFEEEVFSSYFERMHHLLRKELLKDPYWYDLITPFKTYLRYHRIGSEDPNNWPENKAAKDTNELEESRKQQAIRAAAEAKKAAAEKRAKAKKEIDEQKQQEKAIQDELDMSEKEAAAEKLAEQEAELDY